MSAGVWYGKRMWLGLGFALVLALALDALGALLLARGMVPMAAARAWALGSWAAEKVTLFFESSAGKIKIIENGVAVEYSEEKATEILSQPEVTVTADIGEGQAQAAAWGCDLTHEYININADYRS